MKITIKDRFRAFFARDKYDFWFKEFTDKEKEFTRMDVWELAEVISSSDKGSAEHIVAEYLLNVRLTRMEVKGSYVAAVIAAIGGVVVGKLIS